ncbi:MAG: hypothetical protein ABSC06_24355 [Rhodopila sp.]
MSGLNAKDEASLLFCARGGLRLKLIYDRFLTSSGLDSPVSTSDLMVSRIVAVRVALSRGCPSAYEQIGYEMGSATLRDVARAIGGTGVDLGDAANPMWDELYSRAGLERLLTSPQGAAIRASINWQSDLFREHLESCLGGRTRPILCDTGLSGSTMRLLEEAMPDLNWGCALFARSNYKKLSASHFDRTVGLCVQSDRYSPLNRRSAILRYWHLIESTLEPDLTSVLMFERENGVVRANLEVPGWRDKIAASPGEVFTGILDYIDALPRGDAAARIITDIDDAYSQLRRCVVWPTRADVNLLNIEPRSLDFGRVDSMTGLACEPGIRKALKGSLWREGAVALAASGMRVPLLAGIESAYVLRWALQSIRNRPGLS